MAGSALPIALMMLAQAAPPAPDRPAPPDKVEPRCGVPTGENAIVICAERPQGYRLNPDILEAKRQMKGRSAPRPNNPGVRPDCATVGPAPCMVAGINLIGAALTAIEMASRAAAGKDVGSMFVTDPQASEYQRYQMAKARREAREADEAAAKAKAKAVAKAAAEAKSSPE